MDVDNRYWYLLTISTLILLIFPLLYTVSRITQLSFLKLTQITTPIASVVLSIVLAFLYLNLGVAQEKQTDLIERQIEIQEHQNQILENQTSISKLQFEPDIEIKESEPDHDSFRTILVNNGNGVANRLNLRCELLFNTDGCTPIDDLNLEVEDRPFTLRPALNSLLADEYATSKNMQYYGGYLEPGQEVELRAQIGFLGSERGIPSESYTFSEALDILRQNTINNLDAHLWLVYTDQLGQTHCSKVASGHFDVYHVDCFADAIGGPEGHFQFEDEEMISRIQNMTAQEKGVFRREHPGRNRMLITAVISSSSQMHSSPPLYRQKPILSPFIPSIASAGPPIQGIGRPA
jgi:hypothetical protein